MNPSAAAAALPSLVILLALSGCASAPQREYLPGISAEHREGAAVVIGQRPGARGFAKALLGNFINDQGADLLSVNDRYIKESATSNLGHEYWLSPGVYRMTAECYIRQAGTTSLRNVELQSSLEARHYYKLEVGYTQIRGGMFPKIECNPLLRDVTAEVAAREQAARPQD